MENSVRNPVKEGSRSECPEKGCNKTTQNQEELVKAIEKCSIVVWTHGRTDEVDLKTRK